MKMIRHKFDFILIAIIICTVIACVKTSISSSVSQVAAFTVVNVIPNSIPVISVIGTSSPMDYFFNAQKISYGSFYEYAPIGGNDTVLVVQNNSDTLNTGPKESGLMYYNILKLKIGGTYSLFLCGADTTSPDYLLIDDTLPYHNPSDSVMGIRFVNLSTGSNPISINLEGSPNGSEVSSLPYKGITSFKQYINNSTIIDYLFVVRDAATGDSVTQFDFLANGSSNNGYGLTDPSNNQNNGNLLTFKNITIAVYGSESNPNAPLTTMLVDNY